MMSLIYLQNALIFKDEDINMKFDDCMCVLSQLQPSYEMTRLIPSTQTRANVERPLKLIVIVGIEPTILAGQNSTQRWPVRKNFLHAADDVVFPRARGEVDDRVMLALE